MLVVAGELASVLFGIGTWRSVAVLAMSIAGFVIVCEHLVPLLIVRANPQVVAEFLLPSFRIVASPLAAAHPEPAPAGAPARAGRVGPTTTLDRANGDAAEPVEPRRRPTATSARLLQSIVDFGDTLVREIMTPRPDIVAIRGDATLDELRAQFREQRLLARCRSTTTTSTTSSAWSS